MCSLDETLWLAQKCCSINGHETAAQYDRRIEAEVDAKPITSDSKAAPEVNNQCIAQGCKNESVVNPANSSYAYCREHFHLTKMPSYGKDSRESNERTITSNRNPVQKLREEIAELAVQEFELRREIILAEMKHKAHYREMDALVEKRHVLEESRVKKVGELGIALYGPDWQKADPEVKS